MKKLLFVFTALLSFSLFFNGCVDKTDLTAPEPFNGKSGNADLTKYVAIGNSLTAGYQSGTLFYSAQIYAFPYLIAKQAGVEITGLKVSDPGLGGRLEVKSLSPFALYTNPNAGSPINLTHPAPYQNLGIPGALAYDVLFATNKDNCASAVFAGIPNPYFDLVLRNSSLNLGTQLEQALAQNPTLITLWIGNNDVLGYATSGGTAPSAPTSATQFQQLFGGICNGISQAGKQAVVANIPNVSAIPFFTTVGPQIALSTPWSQLLPSGVVGLVYQKTGGSVGVADSLSLLTGTNLVTLKGSAYAPLLGQPTGKFYSDNGIPVPSGVDTTKPFGFHPENPWPNALILDSDEIQIANQAVANYNDIISATAANFGFAVVDINSVFNQIRANDFTGGTVFNGITFKTTFVTGGLFSLDGVHPTNQGQAIIANEFIKVINSKFNAQFPLIDVSTIPGSLIFAGKINYQNGYPILPPEVFEHLLF
ncbi:MULTISPECIES: SGNH/GDSL hydrolase family protein [Ignavibacterium]|jgi:lysophospholipase L1-like esterase|uniref:SGNH/GDSL hydrolase family protein n=1 Tax=Ignavibacterium TaxID=795750 RepID=UPI0025B7E9ED|nr:MULTISPECIES: SGNH/GDSL hydrolase family protein [Ignavibacterium]MBI5662885.1 SGNH/GDSL hydrolase family protein [Ignavibacterium album]